MLLNLFIGAVLAYTFATFGLPYALLALLFFYIIVKSYTSFDPKKSVPPQQPILDKILATKIDKHSENIVGYLRGDPIYEYVETKNPANGVSTRYYFGDTIQYNRKGQIVRAPLVDELYTASGVIYKEKNNSIHIVA